MCIYVEKRKKKIVVDVAYMCAHGMWLGCNALNIGRVDASHRDTPILGHIDVVLFAKLGHLPWV